MSAPLDYGGLEVFARLPDRRGPNYGDDLLPGIIGAQIVNFGTVPGSADLEGGGLVIDYRPINSDVIFRAVFALNESGMWTEYIRPWALDQT